jgi:hypothetical protein
MCDIERPIIKYQFIRFINNASNILMNGTTLGHKIMPEETYLISGPQIYSYV